MVSITTKKYNQTFAFKCGKIKYMKKNNRILIATHNTGKLEEFKVFLAPFFKEVISLKAFDDHDEVLEDKDTFEGNAIKKAIHFFEKYHIPTLADDSGLEVEALNGYPGIYSARIGIDDHARNEKIIHMLQGLKNRNACMKTVLAYVSDKTEVFEGKMCGTITHQPVGNQGFGYDSIFMIESLNLTFGQLSKNQKLKYSHRGKALKLFIENL